MLGQTQPGAQAIVAEKHLPARAVGRLELADFLEPEVPHIPLRTHVNVADGQPDVMDLSTSWGRCRRRWEQAELSPERHAIGQKPRLHDPTADIAVDTHLVKLDRDAGRLDRARGEVEWAGMRSRAGPPAGDTIVLGKLVDQRNLEVGECASEERCLALDRVRTHHGTDAGSVTDDVGGEDLVGNVVVATSEHLFIETP